MISGCLIAGLQAYVCIFACVRGERAGQASSTGAISRHDIESVERDTLLCAIDVCNLRVASADPVRDAMDLEVYVCAEFGGSQASLF